MTQPGGQRKFWVQGCPFQRGRDFSKKKERGRVIKAENSQVTVLWWECAGYFWRCEENSELKQRLGYKMEFSHPCHFLPPQTHAVTEPLTRRSKLCLFIGVPIIAFSEFPVLGQLLPQT